MATARREPTEWAGAFVPPGAHGAHQIRFARAPDGTQLAYSLAGSGPPLVTVVGLLGHLELDDEHPLIAPSLVLLRSIATCLRYDERGSGLSDREVSDFSLATRVRDLASVVDAAGLDRFMLFAPSDGGPVAIAYAAQHPDRVSHLLLAATFASGGSGYGPGAAHVVPVVARLIRDGWGRDARSRRMLSAGLMPSFGAAELDWLDEHQPVLADAAHVAQAYTAGFRVDASPALTRIRTPAVVLHAVDDPLVAFEEGRRVAATIPRAGLTALDTGGHALPLFPEVMRECRSVITDFLTEQPTVAEPVAPFPSEQDPAGRAAPLSPREEEVVALVARGLANREIAEELVLSPRTVERHLSNIYLKLGASGPTARVTVATHALSWPGGAADVGDPRVAPDD